MLSINRSAAVAHFAVVALSLSLAACGGGGEKKKAKGPVERSIYTSAIDCEAAGKLDYEKCTTAMDLALTLHDKQAPRYKSKVSCEEKEGSEKCERLDEKDFRPRFTAFIVDPTDVKSAKPLYLTNGKDAGFRSVDKEVLLAKNESLTFSKSALDAVDLGKTLGAKKK